METILIADDDTRLLKALTIRLEHEGFTVITAQDGYQAVAAARRDKPALLILDINMPAGSGYSVKERIEQNPELAGTPILFVTGDEHAPAPSTMGANCALLHKPFETSQFLDAVWQALGYPVDQLAAKRA
ncbi:MAG: response regulator [Phycisphaerales bacterium]|nr:response regulator [Phycisphaerales bacterium]